MNLTTKVKIKSIIESHIQYGVIWKQDNGIHYGEKHLKKRQTRHEIDTSWTIDDYDQLIVNIMSGKNNDVHIYWLSHFTQKDFCFNDGEWIVMCGENGVMVTCMKGKPQNYFVNNPG
ncbi:hypothetical protein [Paenisporosarcina indica]|uniref:hypothetical protein n=1 Tax=Paenisporosarcina indica TaxID=650093 RepID=UPI00094F58B9|nr:hypothetical protein [Paenisporosarcina indica]